MSKPKEKRRGGVMDETIIHINFTRHQLMEHLEDVRLKLEEISKREQEKQNKRLPKK